LELFVTGRLAASYRQLIVDITSRADILEVSGVRVQRRRWPEKRPVKSEKKLMNIEHRTFNIEHQIMYSV
jgi:hypothetical protein